MAVQPNHYATGVIPYIPFEIMMMGRFAQPESTRPQLSARWERVDGKLVYRWAVPVDGGFEVGPLPLEGKFAKPNCGA